MFSMIKFVLFFLRELYAHLLVLQPFLPSCITSLLCCRLRT